MVQSFFKQEANFHFNLSDLKRTLGGYLRSECQLNDKLGLRTAVCLCRKAFRQPAKKATLNTSHLLD